MSPCRIDLLKRLLVAALPIFLLQGCAWVLSLDEFVESEAALQTEPDKDAGSELDGKPEADVIQDTENEDGDLLGYAWKASDWSACSKPCDGGVRTREVWCERPDGAPVADVHCEGTKPAASEPCNTQACCTPWCAPRDACGSDGCGGSCGSTCPMTPNLRFCLDGYCVWEHGNNGDVSCDTLCAWGEAVCVSTSTKVGCSVKAVTKCYCW